MYHSGVWSPKLCHKNFKHRNKYSKFRVIETSKSLTKTNAELHHSDTYTPRVHNTMQENQHPFKMVHNKKWWSSRKRIPRGRRISHGKWKNLPSKKVQITGALQVIEQTKIKLETTIKIERGIETWGEERHWNSYKEPNKNFCIVSELKNQI